MDQNSDLFDHIIAFVRGIGIPVTEDAVAGDSFLPAIAVVGGGVVVDRARLQWPGDILHEAGHIAVLDADARAGEVPDDSALELAAMAWSYAAAVELGLDPGVVFHEGGYKGAGPGLAQNYAMGLYIGLSELVAAGMAHTPLTAPKGAPVYPAMARWLR
ncbi:MULTISPECIES: hypothetical protein [unclassified Sphingomonas]|uniref:hypothetical protein n=1 Tax=unclassified Sphingomonas TaxID=196159 RepID=UPI0008350258|nr:MULTISPECIES: hypothetical protein [unclassified Sphingomonas]